MVLASCQSAGGVAREPSSAPARAWDELAPADRLAFMEASVTPRMRALFVAQDPHRYAKFACDTCHGRDGPARGYRMPNPSLLLEPTEWNTAPAPEASRAPSATDAFMARAVVVELSRLLGRAPAEGGCFVCHTREE